MKIIFVLIIFLNPLALAEDLNNNFIYITSNELIVTDNPLVSEFRGNVYVRDIEKQIWSEKIILEYDADNKIKLITAIGNVKIIQAKEEATGEFALYEPQLDKIKMIGNVLLRKEGNTLNGDELTIDLINSNSTMKSHMKNQVSVKIIK